MNKEIISIALALGCVSSIAATNNYDLLGRKGSKMNSPMVYKNLDYSKAKKNEQRKISSSVENQGLAKTGLGNNFAAIEGGYNPRLSGDKKFMFKKYPSSSNTSQGCSYESSPCDWAQYKDLLNNTISAKLKIKENPAPTPASVWDHPHENYSEFYWSWTDPFGNGYGWTHVEGVSFSTSTHIFWGDPNRQPSKYESGEHAFIDFDEVKFGYSGGFINSYWNTSSEVGVFVGVDALPVNLGYEELGQLDNHGKNAGYIRNGSAYNVYNSTVENEMRDTRSYSLIRMASSGQRSFKSRSVIYVGKGHVNSTNPSCGKTEYCRPQVYIGVRNNNDASSNSGYSVEYNNEARDFDDYIYENRTVEFVPSGNWGQSSSTGLPLMYPKAYAANAITVGALNPDSKIAGYTGVAYNTNYNSNHNGVNKPEVYNYSRFQVKTDFERYYDGVDIKPYYEGTEVAAAYTAGMVSTLMASNPFYRWHPEVVKALLLTSNGKEIEAPYVYGQVTTNAPSYKYLYFNDNAAKNLGIYSHYWNGSVQKFVEPGTSDIFFVVDNRGANKGKAFKAAIAWINKGTDIANCNGHTAQDFDLYVYGTNGSTKPTYQNKGTFIKSSTSSVNSFERVVVEASKSNYDWLAFRINLYADNTTSSEHGQAVLGFHLSTDK